MKPVLFKTDNCYLYSPKQNQFLLLHPILYSIVERKRNGISDNEILRINVAKDQISEYSQNSTRSIISYYLQKYYLLKEAGYFDEDEVEKELSARNTADEIEIAFSNTILLVFGITNKCNLDCSYCAYGELYNNYDERNDDDLDFATAKAFLDFFIAKKSSFFNKSYKKKTRINFYGGEPLLNIELIKQIINYLKDRNVIEYFDFGMTTNGTLLIKHAEFLVKEKFDLVVSLDGTKECNSFRVFKNGMQSHNVVIENLEFIQNYFPDFFKNHVKFNSVFNKKSNLTNIEAFFRSNYCTFPIVTEIADHGVNPKYKDEFKNIYSSVRKAVDALPENSGVLKNLRYSNPYTEGLRKVFLQSKFSGTLSKVYTNSQFSRLPTATCVPFSRSVHMTVNGKIFLCERVGHEDYLGDFTKEAEIDFQNAAKVVNQKFDKLKKQCNSCYSAKWCNQCAMTIDDKNGSLKCPLFMNYEKSVGYMSKLFEVFERNPELFPDTMLND